MSHGRAAACLLAALTTLGLAACGTPSSAPAGRTAAKVVGCTPGKAVAHATVHATNSFRFSPAKVCLRLGGTVTWINTTGGLDHTATDEPSLAASAKDASLPAGAHGWNLRLPSGKSAHHKFTKVGVYHYFCIPHETLGMLGVIVVVRHR